MGLKSGLYKNHFMTIMSCSSNHWRTFRAIWMKALFCMNMRFCKSDWWYPPLWASDKWYRWNSRPRPEFWDFCMWFWDSDAQYEWYVFAFELWALWACQNVSLIPPLTEICGWKERIERSSSKRDIASQCTTMSVHHQWPHKLVLSDKECIDNDDDDCQKLSLKECDSWCNEKEKKRCWGD